MAQPYPILDFDGEPEAIIEPSRSLQPLAEMPAHGVITFFQDVITHFVEQGLAREIFALRTEMGRHPIYVHEMHGQPVALFHPGIGAPLAAGLLEEMIALGCRNFVACGGAGVLNRELAQGHLVVPTAAVRDEGTSYHYLPPGREVTPSPRLKGCCAGAISTISSPRLGQPTASTVRHGRAWRCAAPKDA
jgi:hypothetical protein